MNVNEQKLDFADITGQETAIRALTIAAAGGYNILMVDSPDSNARMLAKRFPTILPPMTQVERKESADIWSKCGLDAEKVMEGIRPFRAPHYVASMPALVGGGHPITPGEVSLAHNGVMFLDELDKFSSWTLLSLCQCLKDGEVVLVHTESRTIFPSRFQLLAATKPCPCGYFGDRDYDCRCSAPVIMRYKNKLGRFLRDHIDMVCEVGRIKLGQVLEDKPGTSSARITDEVMAARERAASRTRDGGVGFDMTDLRKVVESCRLGENERHIIERVSDLSGHSIIRVLRVARTIADLDGNERVNEEHLLEALAYRPENFFA